MKPDRLETISLVLVATIVIYRLFVTPAMGLADNGDFSRFLERPGLEHVSSEYADKYFIYFNPKYRITSPSTADDGYRSSTEIFVRAARGLTIALIDKELFDIRVLGALYLALFLLAIYLSLVATRGLRLRARVVLALLIVFILTDAGYIAYFNTFYSEPTALVALLLAQGCALLLITRESKSWVVLAGYFAAIAILTTAKPMYALFALPLGLFGVYLSARVGFAHRLKLGVTLACALCALAFWYQSQTPQWLRRNANYIAIFLDLLPNSIAPEQDLADLGLEPFWQRYIGVNPYGNGSPINIPSLRIDFENRITTATIAKFYLVRPGRLLDLFQRCSRHMLIARVTHLGYYDKNSGRPPRAQPFGPWSEIRDVIFPKNLWMLCGFLLLGGLVSVIGAIRQPQRRAWFTALGTVLVIAALQFLVPVVTVGEPDVERHLFLYSLIFDIVLISAIVVLFNLDAIWAWHNAGVQSSTEAAR